MQPDLDSKETSSASAPTRICVVCGKPFVPEGTDDQCCSPICRTLRITLAVTDRRKQEEAKRNAELDAMKQPPRFNLKEHPKARAEWFMSLPDNYKPKFLRFLTPHELEFAKAIEQRRMSEDRMLSGFFVKKGKIVEVKSKGESDNEEFNDQPDTCNTEGTDDDAFFS